ncbi:MAG TPA: NYN domain-containing protein [Pyrinomonadaceae bacterium]|nr:NYN domain-containing protein [Pyrinomonadaceae bacterium]
MSYLVDGNNVMGQRIGWHRDKAGARRRLLEELARFARSARVSVAVVFDGAPDEHFPDGSSFMGVRVHYAARGSDADSRIKQMVEASRERRTLKVITSDRALADYVRLCGAEVIRAGEFRRRLDEADAGGAGGRGGSTATGHEGVRPAELEEWMHYFGVAPEDEPEEPPGATPKGGPGATRGGPKATKPGGRRASKGRRR